MSEQFHSVVMVALLTTLGQGCALDEGRDDDLGIDDRGSGERLWAKPNGKGFECSSDEPCSLSSALDQAGNGDTITLKDGTYEGKWETQDKGVTIEAQNRRKAVILKTDSSSDYVIRIKHSDTTIRGLKVDGIGKADGIIQFQGGSGTYKNVVIEDNHVLNASSSGIKLGRGADWDLIEDVTIRGNLVEDMGLVKKGECFYIGADTNMTEKPGAKGKFVIRDIEIYDNTCRRFTHNGLDFKLNISNVDAHHNLFEDQHTSAFKANEGALCIKGNNSMPTANIRVHDNVFRDIDDAGPAIIQIAARGGHVVRDNVFMNAGGKTTRAIRDRVPGTGAPSQIKDNLWCKITNQEIADSTGVMKISNNKGLGSSDPNCKARINEILSEMGNGDDGGDDDVGDGGGGSDEGRFLQKDGLVCFEAENFHQDTATSSHSWEFDSSEGGHSGDTAMIAEPSSGNVSFGDGPSMEFEVKFTSSGTHALWVRGLAAHGGDDSLHVGLDGKALLDNFGWKDQSGDWAWKSKTVNIPSTGEHEISILMREGGFRIDKIVLTKDQGFDPNDTDPPQSSRAPL